LNRLSKWLRSFGPEVLVCINSYPLFYGHLPRMLSGVRVPIVEIFHSSEVAPREDRQMRLIYRHLFNFSDRIIYVSEAQRVMWESRGIRHDRGACIHNGVDIDYFSDRYSTDEKAEQRARWGFSPTDFVIGICAELRPEKQHGDLLAAISLLKQEGMSAKCLIIGDGPCRGEIERKIRNLGLESDVAIIGFPGRRAAFHCSMYVPGHRIFSGGSILAGCTGSHKWENNGRSLPQSTKSISQVLAAENASISPASADHQKSTIFPNKPSCEGEECPCIPRFPNMPSCVWVKNSHVLWQIPELLHISLTFVTQNQNQRLKGRPQE
jgi:glycosyltransferase involved in cell wall biosynthesis